jgi:hypothetical protein
MAVLAAGIAIMWWPALVAGRTIVQGDAALYGLPLWHVLRQALAGHGALTWLPGLYGGHPMFAEGQGGFVAPLNLAFGGIVAPLAGTIAAMNLFPVATMLLGGLGLILLCRRLALGVWPTTFVTVAVIFAPGWAGEQQNPTICGSIMWVPWCLLAAEALARAPTPRRGVWLGVACALIVLSGYPQTLYATLLYVGVRLIVAPPAGGLPTLRRAAVALLVAGVVGIGLAAVQLLPLLELVGQSHRAGGVDLIAQPTLRLQARDLLFSQGSFRPSFFGSAGCALLVACAIGGASGGGAARAGAAGGAPVARGHAAATLLLALLGTGSNNPVSGFLYDHGLIPGMHFFRSATMYFVIATVGAGVLGGLALQRWSERGPTRRDLVAAASLLALAGLGVWAHDGAPAWRAQLAVAVLGGVAVATLHRPGGRRWIGPAVTLLLLAETAALRLHPVVFFDPAILGEPDDLAAIKRAPDWRDFHTLDSTFYGAIGVEPPWLPNYLPAFANAQRALGNLTALRWQMLSMSGETALELARRGSIETRLTDETAGRGTPGARLIDALAVRVIASMSPCAAPAFTTLAAVPGLQICENRAARPRLQFYERHRQVASPQAALADITAHGAADLVVEAPPGTNLPADAPGGGDLRVEKASPTLYRVVVAARAPGWLFLADAPYPGWRATIDGRPAPLLAAQVLGKAVPVPAGSHVVVIRFVPVSIYLGAALGLLTLAGLAIAAATTLARDRGADPACVRPAA